MTDTIIIRPLTSQAYPTCWQAMQDFTNQRTPETPDEIWLVEHPPVFTQGQNGKPEHILNPGNIPIIKVDRGGQVTYHGPGQLVSYILIDIRRKKMNIRELVSALEQAIIDLCAEYQIAAFAKKDAPGVYVETVNSRTLLARAPVPSTRLGSAAKLRNDDNIVQAKLCSVGLRIRRGCSYHGLALNVAMDLEPFSRINPCGFSGLTMTQLSTLGGPQYMATVSTKLVEYLAKNLRYTSAVSCHPEEHAFCDEGSP